MTNINEKTDISNIFDTLGFDIKKSFLKQAGLSKIINKKFDEMNDFHKMCIEMSLIRYIEYVNYISQQPKKSRKNNDFYRIVFVGQKEWQVELFDFVSKIESIIAKIPYSYDVTSMNYDFICNLAIEIYSENINK